VSVLLLKSCSGQIVSVAISSINLISVSISNRANEVPHEPRVLRQLFRMLFTRTLNNLDWTNCVGILSYQVDTSV